MFSLYSLFFYTVIISVACAESSTNSIEQSLEFINNAVNRSKIVNNPNIILVIGNTGSGKSTLVHYVAGDASKLTSNEPLNPNQNDYDIHDGLDPDNGVPISSTVSRTFIPEMVIDENKNVWYDCPGFADTRNETVDIANAVLRKRIIRSAKNIKIVMVVNYESVTKGHNRDDFDNLLKYTTQMLKQYSHFVESISLVVTKAPTRHIQRTGIVENSEGSVQNTTAEFLTDYYYILMEKSKFKLAQIKLVQALLKNSDGTYPKISIFWKPDETGPFSEIKKLKRGRELIRKSILEDTKYVEMRPNDFGFPMSDQARLFIKNMKDKAVAKLESQLKNINELVQKEVKRSIQSTQDFRRMLKIVHIGQLKVEYFGQIDQFNVNNLTKLIEELVKDIGLQPPPINVYDLNRIVTEEDTLSAMNALDQTAFVSPRMLTTQLIDFKSYFEKISDFFKECEQDIQSDMAIEIPRIINNISLALTNLNQQLLSKIQEKLEERKGYHNKLNLLSVGKTSINSVGNVIKFEHIIDQYAVLISNLNITSIDKSILDRTEQKGTYLFELVSLSKMDPIIPVGNWYANSSDAIEFIKKCENDIQNDILIEIPQIINNISISLGKIDQKLLAALNKKLKERRNYNDKLNFLHIGVESIRFVGNASKLEQRIKQFSTLIQTLNVTSIDMNEINQITQNGTYLNELVSLSKYPTVIPIGNWIINSSAAIDFIQKSENNIQNDILIEIPKVINNISTSIANIDQQLLASLKEKIKDQNDHSNKLKFLKIVKKLIANAMTLEQRIEQFSTLLRGMIITSVDVSELNQISQNAIYLNELVSLSKFTTIIPVRNWIADSSSSIEYLKKYEFDTLSIEIPQIINDISTSLRNFDRQLLAAIQRKMEKTSGYEAKLSVLQSGKTSITLSGSPQTLGQRLKQFKNLITTLALTSIDRNALTQLEQNDIYLNELVSLSNTSSVIPTQNWIADSSSAVEYLHKYEINKPNEKPQQNVFHLRDQNSTQLLNKLAIVDQQLLTVLKNMNLNANQNTYNLYDIKDNYLELVSNTNSLEQDVKEYSSKMQRLFGALKERVRNLTGYHKLNYLQTLLSSINLDARPLNAATLRQRIEQFSFLMQEFHATTSSAMDTLRQIENNPSDGNLAVNSSEAIDFISSEYAWYLFLDDVYNFLTSYNVQQDVSRYNVADLSNWGRMTNTQNLIITSYNFNAFKNRFNNTQNFVPTSSKLSDLNDIIDLTLKSKVEFYCDSDTVTFIGNYVKSSDIQPSKCSVNLRNQLKRIYVFVVDIFYVDSDLNLNGIENVDLIILANKWHILQSTKFHLNGLDGATQEPPTTISTSGNPGNRGTNSGNFFGMANEIKSGTLLTIELFGGRGGDGQDGTGSPDIKLEHRPGAIGIKSYYPGTRKKNYVFK